MVFDREPTGVHRDAHEDHGDRRERWAAKEEWTRERFAEAAGAEATKRRRLEDEIAVAHLDLVDTLAGRIAKDARDLRDVRQVGCIGLVKAVRRFDTARGVPFVPFAVPTIGGEIKRHLRDNGWFVRPPRPVQELRSLALRATNELTQLIGREPTMAELARQLDRGVPDVIAALATDSSLHPTSLDAPLTADDGTPFGQTISSHDDSFDRVDLAISMRAAMRTLTPREQHIVFLRFVQYRPQREIAAEIGVTQMQISRLLTRILAQLREELGEFAPSGFSGTAA